MAISAKIRRLTDTATHRYVRLGNLVSVSLVICQVSRPSLSSVTYFLGLPFGFATSPFLKGFKFCSFAISLYYFTISVPQFGHKLTSVFVLSFCFISSSKSSISNPQSSSSCGNQLLARSFQSHSP